MKRMVLVGMFVCFVASLVLAVSAFEDSVILKIHPEHRGEAIIREVRLKDGTRCAVVYYSQGTGMSCDW